MTEEKYYFAFVSNENRMIGFTADRLKDPKTIDLSMFPKNVHYDILEIPDSLMGSVDFIKKLYKSKPESKDLIVLTLDSLRDAFINKKPVEVIYNGLYNIEILLNYYLYFGLFDELTTEEVLIRIGKIEKYLETHKNDDEDEKRLIKIILMELNDMLEE